MEPRERAQKHLERLDICVKAVEIKWGIPFMVEQLVSPELAAKFQRQWTSLSEAIMDGRHEDVCTLADGALRGVWAMDKEASNKEEIPALVVVGLGVIEETPKLPNTENNKLGKEFWANGGDEINF